MYMRGWASAVVCGLSLLLAACAPSSWAAGALLHPFRRPVDRVPSGPVETITVESDGVTLKGWRFGVRGEPRGTLVFLHGVADNRAAGIGIAERFTARGFDVIAYDSRAHGESTGNACTYGYYEKKDLSRVIDTVGRTPVIVVGHSLGAAVALQAAADDSRISSVVALETFSDLRTVARERAPFVLTRGMIANAFAEAETRGAFKVDEVSPVSAAPLIRVPVLLVHGANDSETNADHSRRVFEALRGPKELIIVPGAGHNGSLNHAVWARIEGWIDRAIARDAATPLAVPPTDPLASRGAPAGSLPGSRLRSEPPPRASASPRR
jgi:pimeloyl-ACP methyl ester carboxylesterase